MSLDTIQLETSGKWEKIEKNDALVQLEDIKDVKKYLEKLSGANKDSRLKNPEIQKQVTLFLETAANNGLSKNLNKFNAKKFDTDGESGLDKFEFEQFSKSIQWAIEQIIALDGTRAFDRIHTETQEKWGWTNPDIWLADKSGQVTQAIFGENGSAWLAERAIKSVWNLSEEELHTMSERPFSLSVQGWKDLSILLAKEIGSWVEDAIKFIANIPAWVILLPRYLSYRIDSNSDDLQKKTEWEIKLAEMVGNNSSLSLVELLGEKWVQMIQELWKMMKSGKQWDIAKLLVTIAGLLTGGALAAKWLAKMSRRTGVEMARRGIGRTVEWRALRNGLRDTAKVAWKVAEVAGKVDNVISGNAALWQVTKKVASGITKVAPAMGMAANDVSNISELDRARVRKQSQQAADAVSSTEMKATGTDGPIPTIRASNEGNFAGRSDESLRTELAYSRSFKDSDARLSPHEGKLAGEIARRANPEWASKQPSVTQVERRVPEPGIVINFAEKKAKELWVFRDSILLGAEKPPLVYIERNGGIEIGRFHSMDPSGRALIEVISNEGKIGLKPVSLEDLARFNDPEKRISQRITPEIRANKIKMEQAYAKSGVNPLEIQINAMLSDTERIAKAEKLLGRSLDTWENLAIFHIHENISKWIYNNSTGNLMNMAKTWEKMTGNTMKNPAKFAEFRTLVEHGILWTSSEIQAETKKLLQKINSHGIDSLADAIEWKKITQPQLNAMVSEYSKEHGFDPKKLDAFLRDTFDISGYDGDQASMLDLAIKYTKEGHIRWLISWIKDVTSSTMLDHLKWWGEWNTELIQTFLQDGNPSAKKELLKILETNEWLRNKFLSGDLRWSLLKTLGENYATQHKIITDIIGDEKLLKTLAPEDLKELDSILNKMIESKIVSGGFADSLVSKMKLILDSNNPEKRIKFFIQNGDEKIADLLRTPSPERAAWNTRFEKMKLTDNWLVNQMNMIKRWEIWFFDATLLENFFNENFLKLGKEAQREFIKTQIISIDWRYRSALEQFPSFKKELETRWLI